MKAIGIQQSDWLEPSTNEGGKWPRRFILTQGFVSGVNPEHPLVISILIRWTQPLTKFVRRSIFLFGASITVFIMPLGQAEGATADGIMLKGLYEYSLFQGGQSVSYSNRYNFEVSIKDCSWIVKYEDASAPTDGNLSQPRKTAGCDGTNIYVIQFGDPKAAQMALESSYNTLKHKLPVAMATVYRDAYPPPKEPILQHIWLAFISSRCLLSHQEGRTKPPFYVDMGVFSDAEYKCDYRWLTNDTIRELFLVADGWYFSRDPQSGKLVKNQLPPPSDKGYTTGIGRWLQSTNIGGISVPVDFEFTIFSPAPGGSISSNNLLKVGIFHCRVTDAQIAGIPQIPPELPMGLTLVSDRRFQDQGHAFVNYPTTNGWLTLHDRHLTELLELAPKISIDAEALAEMGIRPIGLASSQTGVIPIHSQLGIVRIVIGVAMGISLIVLVKILKKTVKT